MPYLDPISRAEVRKMRVLETPNLKPLSPKTASAKVPKPPFTGKRILSARTWTMPDLGICRRRVVQLHREWGSWHGKITTQCSFRGLGFILSVLKLPCAYGMRLFNLLLHTFVLVTSRGCDWMAVMVPLLLLVVMLEKNTK